MELVLWKNLKMGLIRESFISLIRKEIYLKLLHNPQEHVINNYLCLTSLITIYAIYIRVVLGVFIAAFIVHRTEGQ